MVHNGAATAMKEQCILALSPASQETISKHAPFPNWYTYFQA